MIALLLSTAWAFELHGKDWSHHGAPVQEDFYLSAESFPDYWGPRNNIEDAYLLGLWVWNVEGQAPLYLPYSGTTSDTQYGGGNNDQNTTLYGGKDWGYALAAAVYNSSNGQLTDCDIKFYDSNFNGNITWSFKEEGASSGEMDFTHTVIHEMGHCIGFSHSNVDDAIMGPYNESGTGWERRHLTDDDVAGLQYMYGEAIVDLRVDAITVTDEDGDDVARPGERLDIAVQLSNAGDARSIDVVGVLSADDESRLDWIEGASALGDLKAGSDAGTEADQLYFSAQVLDDCEGQDEVTLQVIADDAGKNKVDVEYLLAIDCRDPSQVASEDEPGTEETRAGCGCATGATPSGWLGLILLASLCRRDGV